VDFVISIRTKKQEYTATVAKIHVSDSFTIGVSERKELPFSYKLPKDFLISSQSVAYYFVTNLDIAAGLDNRDHDYVRINPPQRLNNLIAAFEQLGFHEKHGSRSFNGYTQEFEFAPTSFLRGEVEEVEFIVALEENKINMLLEVDLYTYGRREYEVKREITLSNDLLYDLPGLVDFLERVLTEIVENPNTYLFQRDFMAYKTHGKHRHSGFAGALGGMAVGLLGGVIIAEIMDEVMGEMVEGVLGDTGEELESAFGGEEEEGGFFDFFGGEDE
jgi:sporulation-control protein